MALNTCSFAGNLVADSTGERVYAMPTHKFIENATMIETTEEN